jgi:DnaJ family protein C protein 28
MAARFTHLIDELIREAESQGQFDNLPGRGKPLRLDENPYEDPAWRMAYRVLRANGFSLPCLEVRRQIEADLQSARHELARSWSWRRDQPAQDFIEGEWRRALTAFREKVAGLNQRIFDYNLALPSDLLQRRQIDVEEEIDRITQGAD